MIKKNNVRILMLRLSIKIQFLMCWEPPCLVSEAVTPPWLRLSLGTISHKGDKAYLAGSGAASACFTLPCLAPSK